ncbi:Cytidylate kinase [Ruminococcus sp. YE71]|uniref:cytidylate kinase-like family protein n=1 Tax=unclassified Ruminococcus TaxID=2608920 RepID=UPI0008807B4F|nr:MULTISPECIES: cytidylate kinase-like family protein [unclassified Ruminococcus]SDA26545.1 Cytidylate kinase [Ruminococcus sp. YE78]SFW44216.1 Cytidylate kinase [Ruminococcus sp. YE71]
MSQIIISVGREFGSGGRVIAEKLAERFGVPLYDRHLITEIAEKTGLTEEQVEKFNEAPKMKIISRRVNGYSNSIEDNIAEMQFDILDKKAESGESFVVVGRCSETKLKKYPALISLFILGDMEKKIERVMKVYELDEEEAKKFILKKDKKRKRYHNYHCQGKWGDSRLYDLSVNSSKLGIDRTVDMLEDYIKARVEAAE